MSKPLRVLHVFARMDRGGAESMIMNIYRKIDKTKVQFDFIVHTTEECAFDKEILDLGGRIYHVPQYKVLNHLDYKKKWVLFFLEHPEYKIIHSHVRSTASIYLKIAKKRGLTTIIHSHSTSNGEGFTALIKNLLQLGIKKNVDYFVAASEKAGKWLFGSDILLRDNFFVLNNAIDTSDYIYDQTTRKNKRTELGISNQVVIGHVGNFKKVKNHDFLIDVFKEFHNNNSNSLLVLVGDGVLKSDIQKKVHQYKLDEYVLYLGTRSDVNEILQAIDFFVFPSFFEGLPVTVIEAQAAGLPILLSDRITKEVAITEQIDYLSIEKNPTVWADKIQMKLNRHEREDMTDSILNSGYDVVEVAKKLQVFYTEIEKCK